MANDSGFEALQQLVMGDMEKVFTQAVIDHANNPRRVGSLSGADGFALIHSDCGESMEIWLNIKNGRIGDFRFWSDGCGATVACGSMVGELVCGKTVYEAMKIKEQDIVEAFKGLPEGNVHCAVLAVKTLKEAVKNYLARQKVGKNEGE